MTHVRSRIGALPRIDSRPRRPMATYTPPSPAPFVDVPRPDSARGTLGWWFIALGLIAFGAVAGGFAMWLSMT
jgi:hypothetical protein